MVASTNIFPPESIVTTRFASSRSHPSFINISCSSFLSVLSLIFPARINSIIGSDNGSTRKNNLLWRLGDLAIIGPALPEIVSR